MSCLLRATLLLSAALLLTACEQPCRDTFRSMAALVPLTCEAGASLTFERSAGVDLAVCRCPSTGDAGGAR